RLDRPVAISASCSLASIVIGFLLVPRLGITGPALAILVTALLAQILFLRHAAHHLDQGVSTYLGTVALRPFVASAVVALIAILMKDILGANRFLELGLGVLASLLAYVPIAYVLALDAKERQWLRGRLAPALRFGRLRP
ncbi:MAG TPA: polysaccharide biosynthesis C-terminal domain-containing protein, partial [Candidatus Eisenbacteria bacterium]|nr:polysaccharide biosynthesis C-terminal domain-containing protein [Candidatus Eisenbacteria bacterium]